MPSAIDTTETVVPPRGIACPPLSDNSAAGPDSGRVVVDLVGGDDLVGLQIPEVESLLGGVRRAKARLDGFETELVGALEVLKRRARMSDPEPDSGAGSDQGPDGDPDLDHQPDGSGGPGSEADDPESDPNPDPGPRPDPDPEPAPVPSARKSRLNSERSRLAREYPPVAAALKAGRINIEQFDLLTRSGLPDKVINRLLDKAIESGSADATRDLVQQAKSERDRKNPELRLARQRDRRRFSTGIDEDGNRWFNLVVDPLTGEAIMTLFQTAERREWQLTDKPSKNRRTATQRAADAFTGLITNQPTDDKNNKNKKRAGSLPDHGAHLVIDLDNYLRIMLGDTTAVAHTIGGSQVPASLWKQFRDHGAELFAWVLAADGVEMNLARGSRHATEVQKMAIAIRDGTCVTERCDRHPGACDGHHLIEWEHHGLSNIASMALQCPTHHTWLHQTGCRIQPGNQPGQWQLTQTHTGKTIHTWTNPPPPWRQPTD